MDQKSLLTNLPVNPGVYRMLNANAEVLYVGKAKNLRKRVTSYFNRQLDNKTQALMAQVKDVEVTITPSETEALLLENHLIKTLQPHYNILFKDDKSYPYLVLSQHEFPRLYFYRGAKKSGEKYFGPYPSSKAARETLQLLQKLFLLRTCSDYFFANRSRPCVLHQIKRCSAACVKYIDNAGYEQAINLVELFLQGKSAAIIKQLAVRMEQASKAQDYELAAFYRDQIAALRSVQQQQAVLGNDEACDVIAVVEKGGYYSVNIVFLRNGGVVENKAYFPRLNVAVADTAMILQAFLLQYYLHEERQLALPNKIVLAIKPPELKLLKTVIKVQFVTKPRGQIKQLLHMATSNAEHALQNLLASKANATERLADFCAAFGLEVMPQRLECFDISHTAGQHTMASMVVFNAAGPAQDAYRKFSIRDVNPGDDYAAMAEALRRRFQHEEWPQPEVLIIDGGKGQLHAVEQVLMELGLTEILLLAVAKGVTRKPGKEVIYVADRASSVKLQPTSAALHLIQHLRDEAHRFAISGHRVQRAKAKTISQLESIPGIGAKRRAELLRHFGGFRELQSASIDELAKTPGISCKLAEQIYTALR